MLLAIQLEYFGKNKNPLSLNVNLKPLELDKPYTGDFLNISYYTAYEVAALSTNHAGQSTTSEVKF